MLACFSYQPKPFSIHLPQCLDSSSFLRMINSLVFEWIAIFSRRAISPCPSQSTAPLRLTSVVLNWSDRGEKCVELMYEAAEDANDIFQVSVINRRGKKFQFQIRPSPIVTPSSSPAIWPSPAAAIPSETPPPAPDRPAGFGASALTSVTPGRGNRRGPLAEPRFFSGTHHCQFRRPAPHLA